jgi:hypothetical protein
VKYLELFDPGKWLVAQAVRTDTLDLEGYLGTTFKLKLENHDAWLGNSWERVL